MHRGKKQKLLRLRSLSGKRKDTFSRVGRHSGSVSWVTGVRSGVWSRSGSGSTSFPWSYCER